jgi:glycosyltransferase involved in cell wall biosynthesis
MRTLDAKISVILVLYNAEKHLEQCIDSILSQDYGNMEVIAVVNGQQKDGTERIVLNYAHRDRRVRVLYNRDSHRIGDGLRIAVENVSGDYFLIVDGDDYLLPGAVSTLCSCAEQNRADVVVGNIVRVSDNGEVTGEIGLPDFAVLSCNDYLLQSFWRMDYLYHAKLYRTALLREHQMQYLPVSLGADMLLHYQLVLNAGRVVRCLEDIHCYRDNACSISNNPTEKKLFDTFESFLCMEGLFEKHGIYNNPEAAHAFKSQGLISAAQCLIRGGEGFYRRYATQLDSLLGCGVLHQTQVRRYLMNWPHYYYLLVVYAKSRVAGDLFSRMLNTARGLRRAVGGVRARVSCWNQAR